MKETLQHLKQLDYLKRELRKEIDHCECVGSGRSCPGDINTMRCDECGKTPLSVYFGQAIAKNFTKNPKSRPTKIQIEELEDYRKLKKDEAIFHRKKREEYFKSLNQQ